MSSRDAALDLAQDGPTLTAALVDIPSVSGTEAALADLVEDALRAVPHLAVDRDGDAVVARTDSGRAQRVLLAGHLDTVPEADNLPSRRADGIVHGLGSCDMKAGLAVALRLAATVPAPTRDVTYVFYDGEEVEAERNGLGRILRAHPEWLAGDLAVLMEPTAVAVEGGCQGTLRVEAVATGRRAHSARWWTGRNAIHEAAGILDRLVAYQPRRVEIDGLEYREGLNAVGISGGVAGNVLPDRCAVTVNFRFAPDRSLAEAFVHVSEVLAPYEVNQLDGAEGAMPRLDQPAASAFVAAMGRPPRAKLGWTDVARFAALGVPAVNFGPGDPLLAHTPQEHVPDDQIIECETLLRGWLIA